MTKKKKQRKEPFGRPTKYEKKYCEMLIEHMGSGYSFEAFAGVLSVTPTTLYNWLKTEPDFLEAKNVAFGRNRMFWEEQGVKGMWTDGNKKFNSTAWIFNMKNRFGWSDRKEDEDTQKIQTVRIELPGQNAQQVISMEPVKEIEAANDADV